MSKRINTEMMGGLLHSSLRFRPRPQTTEEVWESCKRGRSHRFPMYHKTNKRDTDERTPHTRERDKLTGSL